MKRKAKRTTSPAVPGKETPAAPRRKARPGAAAAPDALQGNRGAAGRNQGEVRIIGGALRGRRLVYSGRSGTRPMKDRVREAAFNLLGPAVVGLHAVDLFAGTGALGLEAVSRGAVSATLIEHHVPSAKQIRDSVAQLGLSDSVQVQAADTFVWSRRDLGELRRDVPWLIFCSPPYRLYQEKHAAMLELIDRLCRQAPPESMLVVEADARFDFSQLPHAERWTVRTYPPAVLGILRDTQA